MPGLSDEAKITFSISLDTILSLLGSTMLMVTVIAISILGEKL